MEAPQARTTITKVATLCRFILLGAIALVLAASLPRPASGQMTVGSIARGQISGIVFVDSDTTPASRVRVDVQAVAGGQVATAFTDPTGHFEANATMSGPYVVRVDEQGYEPVEQRVDPNMEGAPSSVMITLHRQRSAALPVSASGYTVSVHDLKVPGKARHAFDKGLELMSKRDFSGGLEHFKEATDAFPDYYEAYYQAGMANMELRRDDEAEHAFQRAIDLSGGGYADAQFALGALLCDKQQFTEAERVLRRAIDIKSDSWKGHLFIAQALFGLGRLNDAEKSVREALLRKADIPSAFIILANVHIRRHEYILGVQDLDKFLELKPEGPSSEQAKAVRDAAERVVSRLARMGSVPQFVY